MSTATAPVRDGPPLVSIPAFELPEQRKALMDVRRHYIGAVKASIQIVRFIENVLDLEAAQFNEPTEGAAPVKGPAPLEAHSPAKEAT